MDQVQIANLALQKIRAKRLISSFNEKSIEANAVSTCYESIRDELLEESPWSFATKRFALAQLATPPVFTDDGCSKAYSLPADFLKITFITDRSALWKIEADAQGKRILVSDTGSLKCKYTFRNDDPNTYPAKFITAFVFRLAEELCFHISEAAKYAELLEQQYGKALASALQSDAQQGSPDQIIQDAWDRGRYIGGPALEEPGSTWWPVIS